MSALVLVLVLVPAVVSALVLVLVPVRELAPVMVPSRLWFLPTGVLIQMDLTASPSIVARRSQQMIGSSSNRDQNESLHCCSSGTAEATRRSMQKHRNRDQSIDV